MYSLFVVRSFIESNSQRLNNCRKQTLLLLLLLMALNSFHNHVTYKNLTMPDGSIYATVSGHTQICAALVDNA